MNKGDFNHCTMLSHNLWVCLLLFFLVWLIDLLLINNLADIAKIDDEDRNAMFPKHIVGRKTVLYVNHLQRLNWQPEHAFTIVLKSTMNLTCKNQGFYYNS